ncbi:MAG: hypothetical protein ACKO0V_12405, partial [bacterium]
MSWQALARPEHKPDCQGHDRCKPRKHQAIVKRACFIHNPTKILLGIFESGHWPCALKTTQAVLSREDRIFGNS